MRTTLRIVATLAALALGACIAERPEIDQVAQRGMIGLSKKHILACMGRPAHRVAVGSTDVWTYPVGRVDVEGGPLAPGVNGMASGLGGPADAACSVEIVMTNGAVSQVAYSAPDGGPLRLGERCLFPVRACVVR
jgi:hypothetical protein